MDPTALARTARAALTGAFALAFPVECAGCGAEDVALCAACRAALAPNPRRRVLSEGLVVCSGAEFDGVPARTLRALKEDGRTGLARPLAGLLAAAVSAAADDEAAVSLVPVPTSRAAFRRRGFRVVDLVAHRARLPCHRLLRSVRSTSDQRSLGRDQRRANVRGSMRAAGATGLRVVILDDVVTTGATLGEAARALRHAGADVVGAATIAATPRIRRG